MRAAAVRWIRSLLFAAVVILPASTTFAADGPAPEMVGPAEGYAEVAESLTGFIESEIKRKSIPALSIALVDGDRVVWARGFGTAQQETGRKATAKTVYRVGSISKLLTDVSVMRLVASGKLGLDDDVRRYLPEFSPKNPFGGAITLRQLMSHRSGLVRESPVGSYFDATEPTLATTVASLNDTSLVYAPGTKTKYSNAGVAVAGLVLERATATPFEEYVAADLLKPLGMTSSGFRRPTDRADVAEGWMWGHDGQRFVAPDFALGTLPAGNLYSSVTDLGRFVSAVLNEGRLDGRQVIEAAVLKEMLTPMGPEDDPRRFGIGFHLSEFEGDRAFGHAGAVYGFATQLKGLPERKLGVVTVCSLDCANGFVARVSDYALSLLRAREEGRTVERPPTGADLEPAEARQVQGRYLSGDDLLDVTEYAGRLYLRHGSTLREFRRNEDGYAIDDVFGYGPSLAVAAENKLSYSDKEWERQPDLPPENPPERWNGLIGTYGESHIPLYILEDQGKLWALIEWFHFYPLEEISENEFAFPDYGLYPGERLVFQRDANGVATRVVAASVAFDRVAPNGPGETFKIAPLRVPEELKQIALASSPPKEAGSFRTPELVDLAGLDPAIKFDIRYATENNFVGSRFYDVPRAFLQRPAADALLRVHRKAENYGLGVLVYDAYRPWYVTKMFWEATPADLRHFVADPAKGSRHNRGAAVDMTLYDRATGRPVETVAGYDEFSTRAYPQFPGGTSRQRWYRHLLRRLMEEEGFAVYEYEWWHFDFGDWRKYPILNVPFDEVTAE